MNYAWKELWTSYFHKHPISIKKNKENKSRRNHLFYFFCQITISQSGLMLFGKLISTLWNWSFCFYIFIAIVKLHYSRLSKYLRVFLCAFFLLVFFFKFCHHLFLQFGLAFSFSCLSFFFPLSFVVVSFKIKCLRLCPFSFESISTSRKTFVKGRKISLSALRDLSISGPNLRVFLLTSISLIVCSLVNYGSSFFRWIFKTAITIPTFWENSWKLRSEWSTKTRK